MSSRLTELTRSRAFHGLTEDDCLVWFGVSPQTLERIEAGEVEPSAELEQRIVIFLRAVGGSLSPPGPADTPGSPRASHSGDPTGGAGFEPLARAADFSGGAM